MIQKLISDPVIDEIHRVRREIADKFGEDFAAMLEDARRRQESSVRPTWQPKAANKAIHPSDGGTLSDDGKSNSAAG